MDSEHYSWNKKKTPLSDMNEGTRFVRAVNVHNIDSSIGDNIMESTKYSVLGM